jgi:hypothetical protein
LSVGAEGCVDDAIFVADESFEGFGLKEAV